MPVCWVAYGRRHLTRAHRGVNKGVKMTDNNTNRTTDTVTIPADNLHRMPGPRKPPSSTAVRSPEFPGPDAEASHQAATAPDCSSGTSSTGSTLRGAPERVLIIWVDRIGRGGNFSTIRRIP
jgi:hypothetical protein